MNNLWKKARNMKPTKSSKNLVLKQSKTMNDQNEFLSQYEKINFLDKSIFNIKRI